MKPLKERLEEIAAEFYMPKDSEYKGSKSVLYQAFINGAEICLEELSKSAGEDNTYDDPIFAKWCDRDKTQWVDRIHYGDLTTVVGAMIRRAYKRGQDSQRLRIAELEGEK